MDYNNKVSYNKIVIHQYDGYQSEPIFCGLDASTYYNDFCDRQCRVPIPSDEILINELEMEMCDKQKVKKANSVKSLKKSLKK